MLGWTADQVTRRTLRIGGRWPTSSPTPVPAGSPRTRPRTTWPRAVSRPDRRKKGDAPCPTTAASGRSRPSGTRSTAPRRRAVLRGADRRGGLLLGLVAALPPRHPVGGRRRDAVGAARPVADARTGRCCPGTCDCTTLFPGEEWKRADAVTGRRLMLGNADVRISYVAAGEAVAAVPQRGRRRVRLRRVRRRHRRDDVRRARGRPGRLRDAPPRHDAPLGAHGDEPLRAYVIEANSHIAPPKRYLSRYGQLLEHAPYCERDLHGPTEPLLVDGHRRRDPGQAPRPVPAGITGTRYVVPDPPVRRRRLGRLPLPVHVQRRRLRAHHRAGAPAAARAPGVRGPELRHLQLRAPQGRLPPAGDPRALLPRQRRLRRGHVLLRRRLRGPQGLRHRAGVDQPASRRPQPRPPARRRGTLAGRGVLRRARRHGRHLPAAGARRGRPGAARTRPTRGAGPGAGPARPYRPG